MHGYITRTIQKQIIRDLKEFPVVAILGPRQCGKSTTAKELGKGISNFLYLDLERPSDIRKLADPELFFNSNADSLICLDEIQRVPHIFPVIRSIIDGRKKPGQFLILGSASRDLLQQSSESLAGRIVYNELSAFTYNEISSLRRMNIQRYWLRGGFPDSLLASDDKISSRWRENFIRTYLERDIPQMGFRIPAEHIRRLWTMCAHYHGQLLNSSLLANALNVSSTTVRTHLNILEQTFMVRLLPPYTANIKKRFVKSPKLYLRDGGVLHGLLELQDTNDLLSHPQVGASWEGVAMENIITILSSWRPSFYRTSNGAEIDLIMERGQSKLAFEFKASSNPSVSKGLYSSLEDIGVQHAWVVVPEGQSSPLTKNITIISLDECLSVLMREYV